MSIYHKYEHNILVSPSETSQKVQTISYKRLINQRLGGGGGENSPEQGAMARGGIRVVDWEGNWEGDSHYALNSLLGQ